MEPETVITFVDQYVHMGFLAFFGLLGLSVVLFVSRLFRLFWLYIHTGHLGDFSVECCLKNFFDEDGLKSVIPLVYGTHPGGIIIDIISYGLLSLLFAVIWLPLVIVVPLVGIAYLLRQRIAKKQEFIARLDGSHS